MTLSSLGFTPMWANGIAVHVRDMGKFGHIEVLPDQEAMLVCPKGTSTKLDPSPAKLMNLIKNLNQ